MSQAIVDIGYIKDRVIAEAIDALADYVEGIVLDNLTDAVMSGSLNLNVDDGITIGNDLFWQRTYGTAPTGTSINNRYLTTFTGNADGTSDVRGFLIDIDARGANNISLVEGLNVGAFVNTTGGTTGTAVTFRSTCTLGDVDPDPPVDGGSLTSAIVYEGHIANEGSHVITNAYVFHAAGIDLGQDGVTGTATNAYAFHAGDQGGERTPGLVTNRACGFVCEDFTGGATITAAFYSEMSSDTGKWNLYLSGSADSAIAGNLRIGSTVAPTADLDVTGNVKFGNGTFFTGTSSTQNTTFASDGTFTTTRSNNSISNVVNLVNNGITASTQGLAINFGLAAGGGSPGNAANGGRIRSVSEDDYSTGPKSDASLVFDVGVDGSPSTALTLLSNKNGILGGNLIFTAAASNKPMLKTSSADLQVRLGDDSAYGVLWADTFTVTSATQMLKSSVAMNNGAAAQTGTLTNAPAAGNPTKWIPFNDNGTTRYIPAW